MQLKQILIFSIILFSTIGIASADTHTVTGTSSNDIQNAIDGAEDGDIVKL